MHHRLHAGANRLKTAQPQQIERCRTQRGHNSSAIAAVTVGFLVELDVTDQVPALMLQRSRTSCSRASGVVGRLVRNNCCA